uniref:Uncharacterized protein n=1 Tax=Amphimedon queenslandica TaxID=400682 RepID=A0A1X7UY16_AMPQE
MATSLLLATPTFCDLIDLLRKLKIYLLLVECFRSLVFVVLDTLPSCHYWPASDIVRCCKEGCRANSLITKVS